MKIIEDGGWHFTNIKTPKELEVKFKNFGHNWEFNNSGINLQDIENMEAHKCYIGPQTEGKTNISAAASTER